MPAQALLLGQDQRQDSAQAMETPITFISDFIWFVCMVLATAARVWLSVLYRSTDGQAYDMQAVSQVAWGT